MTTQTTTHCQRRSAVAASGGSECRRYRALAARVCLAALLCLVAPIAIHAAECNRALPDPVVHVRLPGSPFSALPSADGCRIFVSLAEATGGMRPGVAVLGRADGRVTVERTVSLLGSPSGMALTHDGTLLIVTNGAGVVFLDVTRLTTGAGDAVLGYWREGHGWPMSTYVGVSADDRYLFVSNEAVGTISVIDLQRTRRSGFAQVRRLGSIAVGNQPIGLAFSSDDRFLFATVQSMSAAGWDRICKPEGDPHAGADHSEGAIVVIDMKLAASTPGKSVLRYVPAGCNPVRVVTSRETGRVYVTARGSNKLLAFTERELTGSAPAPRATQVSVGMSPVGVAVIDNGRKVVVGNSDRFGTGAGAASLYVVGSARVEVSSMPVLGLIPSRGFPREIRATADGQTLLVTNFSAGTLQIVDLKRRPWDFALNGARPDALRGPGFAQALTLNSSAPDQRRRMLGSEWLTDASAPRSVTMRETRAPGLLL